MKILPGIMPKDLTELRNKLSLIFDWGGAVQLDLMDGVYVPEATWPYNGENQEEVNKILNEDDGLPYWENFSSDHSLDFVSEKAGELFVDDEIFEMELIEYHIIFELIFGDGELVEFIVSGEVKIDVIGVVHGIRIGVENDRGVM